MKKNNMLRLASVLLVAVLLSTCAVSGVFAQYQSKNGVSDNAIVAKWGVTVEVAEQDATADKLFQQEYAIDTTGLKDSSETAITLAVKAADDNTRNLVAPGTSDDGYKYTVKGTPEVAVEYVQTLTMEIGEKWNVTVDGANKFYCPIVVSVNGEKFCGLNYSSAEAFENAVNAYGSVTKYYAPNSNLANTLTYSWTWAFEGQTGTEMNQTIGYDTVLGDAANAEIAITSSITVTQVN